MVVETLTESPFSLVSELGPYRLKDYLSLPEEQRCELLFGRIYVTPSPNPLHQVTVTVLLGRFRDVARGVGAFVVPAPMDVVLAGHTVVQPDILYIAKERRGIVRERIEGAPDLVVEVLSLATARRDRGEKLKAYAEAGVREYWIAEPGARNVDFLINRGGRFEVVFAVDGVYHSEALPEITLDLAAFWREVDELMAG